MSRLALYRKYRSADFDEVVGQEHITKTLEAAIQKGMAGHAYLFTGPRGVGKTTVARIMAKRLNGLGKDDDIAAELDIVEIDGASNRGIDEIRSLREKVAVAPSKLNYKIYIIDEVHMLTREAFNALLKTLEEPPAHVVFVFATTEVNKLPETIISRTQRFDFRPIVSDALTAQLTMIAKKEKISIEPEAVELIASLSRGGFRDAISLLDQLSVTEGKINAELVRQFTGLQDPQKLQELIVSSIKHQATETISKLNELYGEGADPVRVAGQLLDIVQDKLKDESDNNKTQQLLELADKLHKTQKIFRYTSLPELALQVGLAKEGININQEPKLKNTHMINRPVADQAEILPSKSAKPKNKSLNGPGDATQSQEAKVIKALSVIKHYNNSLYAVLRGSNLKVSNDQVIISCRFSFHRDRMKEAHNNELIEKVFSKVFDKPISTKIEVESKAAGNNQAVDTETELVSSAMAILGGELEGEK